MGQASRWLRSIFTRSRKENDDNRNRNISSKSKWITNLLKSCKDSRGGAAATTSVVAFSSDSGKSLRGGRIARGDDHDSAQRSSECYAIVDDYSHAKAVAAATATAAEAAVIAAQAAAEVVRLTRSGRLEFDPSRRASVVIQSVFRGYLARRALRALRALVRLQALVRGHIVRKRAVEQVRRMHALIRAQARARAIRALVPPSSHSRILDPPTSDDNDHAAQMWNSCKSDKTSHPGRASSKHYDEKQIDKIVMEADSSAKPHGSTKNKNLFLVSDNCSNGYQTPAFSYTSEDLLYLQYSKEIDQHSFYTADNSPRFHTGYRSSSARRGGGGGSSLASSNVNYSESCLDGYTNHPNYMAYTKSSKAKLRSLSTPKQRTQLDRSNSLKCCSSYDYGSRRLSTSGAN